MKRRLVIALGGNALGNNPVRQLELARYTASTIADLIEEGYDVVIGHGNGPQVGMVNLAFEHSAPLLPGGMSMPFPECGAMTQGYIGYHLQQAIRREFARRSIVRQCATVITQVAVDPSDPAFAHPTKPIGLFYTKEEAEQLAAENGYTYIEDAGRGWRRVVPSPLPQKIVELPMVEHLLAAGDVVITVGGGGIPVTEEGPGDYRGVAAVIDKDRASAALALGLKADMLVILTAVDKVSLHYKQPNQLDLDRLTVAEARTFIKQGHFAPGSMLPKVESCIDFVEKSKTGKALITSLERAKEALRGETGTLIVR